MPHIRVALLTVFLAIALFIGPARAADTWKELKTAHFTVVSSAGDRNTQALAWQLEQVRSAISIVSPWAHVDLGKPVFVLAVKDENGMRTLAPSFWERSGDMHPVSVAVTGADRHYIAIRADLRYDVQTQDPVNPHLNAYFIYVTLILQSSFDRDLPLWLSRGLAGVLSNTIVQSDAILVGPLIPTHLEELRSGPRVSLSRLLTATRESPDLSKGDRLAEFDAASWAFVHFLLFGDSGAHQSQLNAFARLLQEGKPPAQAFQEALGPVEKSQAAFDGYLSRSIYQYAKLKIDASIKREGIALRTLPPAEATASRAAFHVAMGRAAEARVSIEEARRADPNQPASDVAEALLLENEGRRDEAIAAYAKAVEHGSDNAYAYYRLALLSWGAHPDRETLVAIDKRLTAATRLNERMASAYAALGEAKAALTGNLDDAIPLVKRAISLEPGEAGHHLSAARVLWRGRQFDAARSEAHAAARLANTDYERRESEQLLASLDKAQAEEKARSR